MEFNLEQEGAAAPGLVIPPGAILQSGHEINDLIVAMTRLLLSQSLLQTRVNLIAVLQRSLRP